MAELRGQTVVIIGASGVVGSGVARAALDAGARVVAVSRDAAKLEAMRERLSIPAAAPLIDVEGDFSDDAGARAATAAIQAAAGGPLHHVLSVQGFVPFAAAPTVTDIAAVRQALDDGLYNNLRAAQALLPLQRALAGSSFTLVSGGLAHVPPPMPSLWLGTLKNAALNALTLALAAETVSDAVRVNTVCIHFGVAPAGGATNQFGMQTDGDTLRLAPAFLGVFAGKQRGQLLCLHGWADAEALAA